MEFFPFKSLAFPCKVSLEDESTDEGEEDAKSSFFSFS